MALQSQLLLGCSHEAERADTVAQGRHRFQPSANSLTSSRLPVLDGLRTALDESFYWHLTDLTTEIRQSSRLLRDLTARSHAHLSRTAIVADHLNIMLACMSRTLRDITAHYEDKTISRENRWKKMYHDMLKEAGGLPLRQRFVLYNDFLILVLYKVTRDKRFEPTLLEQLRTKILDLRRKRNIPDPPPPIAPAMAVVTASAGADQLVQQPRAGALAVPTHVLREHVHWCERVFALPLPAQIDTGLDERIEVNVPMVSVLDPRRPRGNVVMRRSYDNNRFCAKFIVAWNEEPFVVLRMYQGMSLVAWRAHDDLIASREGNAVLLRRWSQSRGGWKEWARFAFVHWEGERCKSLALHGQAGLGKCVLRQEFLLINHLSNAELVLFYTAFFVLKARNPLAAVRPSEYGLADEETLFKA